ncbi:EF-hand and coiled-coil domain-containing protein 1 isoform X2 [Gallus gallus]|uniref:EF-hand and coiled-coil domain-containing protein 1 isoform X2 n=1 Tax=Gallus gallus TaxID=9031 RepID=UPI001AE7B88D|nr:EF-hand and coiled-coil domain-containing protein 1 isoform X2 [Gallus gallus]XP_414315.3 EF-hand and coiled-coil domain-containing protein 1 isoform X2 [Gallus gallus]
MEPPEGWDPYGRPARRTQWLVSALAYHYGLDRGVENEIVVLATGLDQYLQEIFHHLDCAGEGRIPGEDFRTLCQVLGLEEAAEAAADPEECAALWDGLSAELTFRQFHARLCGYFSTKAGSAVPRLPLGRESEHIETQIRLRSPRRRRRDAAGPGSGRRGGEAAERRAAGPCSPECYEEIVALERAEDRIAKLEEENGSLRELVEDMRAALQSSDARCLALQVGLRKSHANHKEEGTCFIGSKRLLTQNHSQTKCLQSVLKEVELIRSSRDGQIEEAIRFNQELERELKSSQEALVSLEDCNRNLKREQAEMRKKVEEARQAVRNSLGKVKELEVKANEVPHLQVYIQQLESELQHYRSEIVKFQLTSRSSPEQKDAAALSDGRCCFSVVQQDRTSPTGRAGISENDEQLFRAVEGQAASDEEEEKWAGEQQPQAACMKEILAKFPCCGSGCDEKKRKKLLTYLETSSVDGYEAAVELEEHISQLSEQLELKGEEVKKLETNMEEMKGSLLTELQQKVEETEMLKMELQMLETERVRLSLVEEKLMDVLQLLQQLRDLNISKRALGKILLSTLESCHDPQHGKAHLFEVLDTLYRQLTACELLQSQPLEKAQSRQSLSNPLVISC